MNLNSELATLIRRSKTAIHNSMPSKIFKLKKDYLKGRLCMSSQDFCFPVSSLKIFPKTFVSLYMVCLLSNETEFFLAKQKVNRTDFASHTCGGCCDLQIIAEGSWP